MGGSSLYMILCSLTFSIVFSFYLCRLRWQLYPVTRRRKSSSKIRYSATCWPINSCFMYYNCNAKIIITPDGWNAIQSIQINVSLLKLGLITFSKLSWVRNVCFIGSNNCWSIRYDIKLVFEVFLEKPLLALIYNAEALNIIPIENDHVWLNGKKCTWTPTIRTS